MRRRFAGSCAVLLVVVVSALAGCDKPSVPDAATTPTSKSAKAPLTVVATSAPLAYFAEAIGGPLVTVSMQGPSDGDPAFWAPSAADVAILQAADLIVLNGAGFEHWRSSVTLPERNVVETADGFRSAWIEVKDGRTHSHGTEGPHSHAGIAFTTWIDLMQAIDQARAIKDALTKRLPEESEQLQWNFAAVERDLRDVDGRVESAIGGQQGLPILFSHPVYDYLIRRYALNAKAVHWEPGEMPSAEELTNLQEMLKDHPARWMIWEDEPGDAIRAKLRELNVECVVFAPASNMGPEWSRWMDVQRANAAELAKVYQ